MAEYAGGIDVIEDIVQVGPQPAPSVTVHHARTQGQKGRAEVVRKSHSDYLATVMTPRELPLMVLCRCGQEVAAHW